MARLERSGVGNRLTDGSAQADALATAAFVLGEDKGMVLIESLKDTEAIFIRKDRTVVCSSGAGAWHVTAR